MSQNVLSTVQKIHTPSPDSHKGQNGKLLIIGGSELFHAASMWSLTVASRIVDLVHYSSIPENNEIVKKAKEEFRNGIVVRREDVKAYIQEDDCILIGPGMTRDSETQNLTNSLLRAYPDKQWVIDAGALQMMDITLIPKNAILTPHHEEFHILLSKLNQKEGDSEKETVREMAKHLQCVVLLKGKIDIASNGNEMMEISGGNEGMTKGGTGDVLAGLIASLSCTNDPWVSTIAGSYINKKAGEKLYKSVGPYFNASDLAAQIPQSMAEILLRK